MKIEDIFKVNITSRLGVAKYRITDYSKEELTPHVLMDKGKSIIERRPFIFSGLTMKAMFVNGSGLFATLEDESRKDANIKGQKWIQAWIDQRTTMINIAKYMCAMNWFGQGNVYFEPTFIEGKDSGKRWLNSLSVVPDSSKIFYNTMSEKDSNYWLHKVEDEMIKIQYKGKFYRTAKYTPYKYSPSTAYYQTSIKAFALPKNKLIHLRQPYTLDGYYGFSFIMSSVDDEEAINKIIRNLIIISSNKAVGKKMISISDENGRIVSEDDIENLEDKLDLDVGENIIVNKKIDVNDMASTGTYDTMMNEIDYLTKDIISGLTPSYMTPWNQSMSLANAQQARLPFIMSNEAEKKVLESFWTQMLIPLLANEAKAKGISLEGLKITFGETQYFSLEERKDFFESLYDNNIITFNHLRDKLDLGIVKNGDIYQRQMEAVLDRQYGEDGTDSYEQERTESQVKVEDARADGQIKVENNKADTSKESFERFNKALALPTFKEALKRKVIKKEDKHEYEFDDEEKDTSRKAKKENDEATNEVLDLINSEVE